jgi:hypothetical protein
MANQVESTADRRIAKAANDLNNFTIQPEELHKFAYATMRRKIADRLKYA